EGRCAAPPGPLEDAVVEIPDAADRRVGPVSRRLFGIGGHVSAPFACRLPGRCAPVREHGGCLPRSSDATRTSSRAAVCRPERPGSPRGPVKLELRDVILRRGRGQDMDPEAEGLLDGLTAVRT